MPAGTTKVALNTPATGTFPTTELPTCTLLALNRAKVTVPSGTLPKSAAGVLVLVTVADTLTFWLDGL